MYALVEAIAAVEERLIPRRERDWRSVSFQYFILSLPDREFSSLARINLGWLPVLMSKGCRWATWGDAMGGDVWCIIAWCWVEQRCATLED